MIQSFAIQTLKNNKIGHLILVFRVVRKIVHQVLERPSDFNASLAIQLEAYRIAFGVFIVRNSFAASLDLLAASQHS